MHIDQLAGRDRFDCRPRILRTFTEAAYWLQSVAIPEHALTSERNLIYLLYGNYPGHPAGYLVWKRVPFTGGIEGYDENALLRYLGSESLDGFIDRTFEDPRTTGILAMDEETFKVLLKRTDVIHPYVSHALGIRKELSQRPTSADTP